MSDPTDGLSQATSPGDASARQLVTILATMMRNAHVHPPTSDAWRGMVKQFSSAVYANASGDGAPVTLTIQHGEVLVNQDVVRPAFGEYNAFNYLMQDLTRLQIGGLRFRPPVNELQIKKLIFSIAELSGGESVTLDRVMEKLEAQGVKDIDVFSHAGASDTFVAGDHRLRAAQVFLAGIDAIADVMRSMRENQAVGLLGAKRFVEAAIDLLAVDRSMALSLTTIKNYRGYLHNHCVNVSLISVLVGAKMGFERKRLADLGLAALLREVGKATLPDALLEKKGRYTKADWDQLKMFPYAAVTGLLRDRGFNERTVRQVLVAFEHQFHTTEDRTLTGREFTLFSRIAQLSAAYDAMCTVRPYRDRPFTPDQALRELIRDRVKHQIDPILLKAFVHAMGMYPVGTLVLLDTGEIGVVCDPPFDDESMARPRIRLIADPKNQGYLAPTRVELNAVDEAGTYTRSIVRTVDAWRYGVNVSKHLLDVDIDTVLN